MEATHASVESGEEIWIGELRYLGKIGPRETERLGGEWIV